MKNITSDSIWVESLNGIVNQNIYNLNISNGINTTKITQDTSNEITGSVTATVLNVRSGPSTSYDILGTLNNGQAVTIIESNFGWYKINWNGSFGYVSSSYIQINNGATVPDVTPPPPTPTGKIKSITIDPGHGGADSGALGPTGLQEKDITLKVGLKVRDLLQAKGYTVVMTRTTDDIPYSDNEATNLQYRCDIANNANTDIFVSIHNNSADDPAAHGTETFSYLDPSEAANLATDVQNQLINSLGLTNRGTKTANYYVLRNTNMTSILAELAFISNPNEEALLNSDSFQNQCAEAIVSGIESYNNS